MAIGFLVTYLSAKPFSPQFGQAVSSRKSPGGSKLLPFKNDAGHLFFGTFNARDLFKYLTILGGGGGVRGPPYYLYFVT